MSKCLRGQQMYDEAPAAPQKPGRRTNRTQVGASLAGTCLRCKGATANRGGLCNRCLPRPAKRTA